MTSIQYFDLLNEDHLIPENRIQMILSILNDVDEITYPDIFMILQEQSRITVTALAKWALTETVRNSLTHPDKDHFNILREMLVTLVLSSDMTAEEAQEFMDGIKDVESGGSSILLDIEMEGSEDNQ